MRQPSSHSFIHPFHMIVLYHNGHPTERATLCCFLPSFIVYFHVVNWYWKTKFTYEHTKCQDMFVISHFILFIPYTVATIHFFAHLLPMFLFVDKYLLRSKNAFQYHTCANAIVMTNMASMMVHPMTRSLI
jgi:hypothetical protein